MIMQLASISDQVQCYDWPKSSLSKTYRPLSRAWPKIRSASWANTSEWMCLVTSENHIDIISFRDAKSKFLHEIVDVPDVRYATFKSLNKRDLAIASGDTIMIYDMKRCFVRKQLGPTHDHSDYFKIMFDARDSFLCAASKNNQISVYDAKGLQTIFYASNTGNLRNFSINDQYGLKIAACTNSGACILWELEGITNIYSEPSKCQICDLVYRDNSILYITESKKCILRDYYNTSTISIINLDYYPKCVDMCIDSIGLAILADDGSIYAYDVRNLSHHFNKIPKQDGDTVTQILFNKHSHSDVTCAPSNVNNYSTADELEIVYEYKSMLNSDVSASTIHGPNTTQYNVMNIKVENLPTVSEIEENQIIGPICCNGDDTLAECTSVHVAQNGAVTEVIRETVKDEMASAITDLKRQVQKVVHDETKSNFYELRMALVKEFIKLQEILDRLQPHRNLVKNDGDKCDNIKMENNC
ncbi:uncharacterized protein [Atheta coriaria]|uniref:uncharacterized protein n=1 Tax=Dalotia coriaria TaxID=877792 RepID=UPI0031F45D25